MMETLKKLCVILLIVCVFIFVFQNVDELRKEITFQFLFFDPMVLNVGYWFVLLFLAGLLTWLCVDTVRIFRKEKEIKGLKKEIKNLGEELSRFRNRAVLDPLADQSSDKA